MFRRGFLLFVLMLVAMTLLTACGGDSLKGAPSKDGEYAVRQGSVSYDGDRFQLLYEDQGGQLRELSGKGLKMVQDERNVLVRDKGEVVLHLREDEPVQTLGRDEGGNYSSPWFPFFLGAVAGNVLGGPSYRYPPTDTFGRSDPLNGSVVTQSPKAPKYEGLPPAPNAVSGQNQGTGGGNAVTNKAGGGTATGEAGGGAVSGQAQGTGAGTAASAKGGFRAGDSSFDRKVSAGSRSGSGGSNVGSGGSKSAPKPKAPSGGRSGGGRSGGRSGGK
jgi:hypothetical protein